MAKIIDDETMENVCILAKLSLSEEEKGKAKAEMQKMLDYVEKQTKHKKRGRKKTSSEIESEQLGQISMFDMGGSNVKTEDIILELHDLDLSTTTPIDAMNILYKMQMKLKQRI